MLRQSVIFALGFAVLAIAGAASAQSEGLEIKHSPNAKRALRLHEEQLDELKKAYFKSLNLPAKRFKQACDRHIDRYAGLLDREMRALTRKGDTEQAEAVQSAIKQTEGWTITPPDAQGLHFLSQADLEVKGSEKANKLGVDLLVNVESAAEAYRKQLEDAFKQYQGKVSTVRQRLQDELAAVVEQEQRVGRGDAVKEVQSAIAQIKQLPPAENPAPSKPKASEVDQLAVKEAKPIDYPAQTEGCYVVSYHDDKGELSHRALLRLSKKGSYSLARYYPDQDGGTWDNTSLPISLKKQRGEWLALYHDTPDGGGVIYEHHAGQLEQKNASYWTKMDDYPIRSEALTCHLYKAQMRFYTGVGLKPGDYVLKMKMRYDKEGQPTNQALRFKAEVFAGNLLITHQSSEDDPNRWEDCVPVLFFGHGGGDVLSLIPFRNFADQNDKLILDKTDPSHIIVRYWWDEGWHKKGLDASLIGSIERMK